MKRTAGTMVMLALLGGCNSSHQPGPGTPNAADGGRPAATDKQAELSVAPEPQRLPDLAASLRLGSPPGHWCPDACSDLQLTAANGGLGSVINSVLHDRDRHTSGVRQASGQEGAAAAPAPLPKNLTGDGPQAAKVRLFNSDLIIINYELKGVDPSGNHGVDLWFRQQGQPWQKAEAAPHQNPPFIIKVNREGLYGFTLLACSPDGSSKPAPRAGDPPQMWMEVDMTKPVVQLLAVEAGIGPKARTWQVRWKAADKNLAPRPITVSYAPTNDGPWTPIATNVENSGRLEWQVAAGIPAHFFVRVEAVDRAGNVGVSQTPNTLPADGAQAEVAILSVEAAAPVYPSHAPRAAATAAPEPNSVANARYNEAEADPSVDVLRDGDGRPVDILQKMRLPVAQPDSHPHRRWR